ncbi:MAG: hypothetical protein AB1416_09360, partial [Actinomycetota bacterium]
MNEETVHHAPGIAAHGARTGVPRAVQAAVGLAAAGIALQAAGAIAHDPGTALPGVVDGAVAAAVLLLV